MKILIEKNTRLVKYAFPDSVFPELLSNCIRVADLTIADLNSSNAELLDIQSIPADFEGNKYCFLSDFVLADIYLLDLGKMQLYKDLESLRAEVAGLIVQVQLACDPVPEELPGVISSIRAMYPVAKSEIESLTPETIHAYVLRGEQIGQAINFLKSML